MEPAVNYKFVSNPDLQKVSDLMIQTWDLPCVEYTPQVLEMYLDLPKADPNLTLAQESQDGSYASFQALIPYCINYKGRDFKTVFGTFFTIKKNHQAAQLLIPQLLELLSRAEAKGYELYYDVRQSRPDDDPFDVLIERLYKRRGMVIKKVDTFRYLVGVRQILESKLSHKRTNSVRLLESIDLPQIKNLISNYKPDVTLYKRINDDNIEYVFLNRAFSSSFVYERNNEILGVVNLIELQVLDEKKKVTNVYFENMLIDRLTKKEQNDFIENVLREMIKKSNFTAAFVPDIDYYPREVFNELSFRKSQRELNLYLGAFKKTVEDVDIESVDSFFLDVY